MGIDIGNFVDIVDFIIVNESYIRIRKSGEFYSIDIYPGNSIEPEFLIESHKIEYDKLRDIFIEVIKNKIETNSELKNSILEIVEGIEK